MISKVLSLHQTQGGSRCLDFTYPSDPRPLKIFTPHEPDRAICLQHRSMVEVRSSKSLEGGGGRVVALERHGICQPNL